MFLSIIFAFTVTLTFAAFIVTFALTVLSIDFFLAVGDRLPLSRPLFLHALLITGVHFLNLV